MRFSYRPTVLGLCLVFIVGGPLVFGADSTASRPLRFGMVRSLFRAADEGTVLASTHLFGQLVGMQTGVKADFTVVDECDELTRKIDVGELDYGVLHGVEYAWLKERFPDVKPLVLAYNQTYKLRAHVLVRADSKDETMADLKGKNLVFPRWSMNHIHLYLHRAVEETGARPAEFFGSVRSPLSIETALDGIVDHEGDVTIVDGAAWEHYRTQKPVRATRLKVLAESAMFPTAAIVYKPETCPKTLTAKLENGLVTAHQRPLTRELLMLWRLSQFSKIPDDYNDLLAGVLKKYPQPFEPVRFVPEKEITSIGAGR